jgi:hypothetical protein
MARYVVLSFENDSEANQFVDSIEDGGRVQVQPAGTFGGVDTLEFNEAKLVALTMKPTLFCECKMQGKTLYGWSKGKKWGLWIHAKCGKPSLRWGSSYKAIIGSAKNLLDEEAPNPMALTPEETKTVQQGGYIGNNPPPGYDQDQEVKV